MKNNIPQLENGFIKIATEVWEALGRYRISGEEWLVLNCIIRKTWGWNKKEDKISLSQFEEYTHLKRQNVFRALKKLSSKRIITIIKKDDSQINYYCPNKIYSQWITIIKKDDSKTTVIKTDYGVSSKRITKLSSKRINTIDNKDTITKYNISNIIPLFEKVNPFYKKFYSNKTERKSLQSIIDKYGVEWTIKLLNKLPAIIKIPYAPQITSPYELEVKMGKLKIFLEQERNKIQKGGVIQL